MSTAFITISIVINAVDDTEDFFAKKPDFLQFKKKRVIDFG